MFRLRPGCYGRSLDCSAVLGQISSGRHCEREFVPQRVGRRYVKLIFINTWYWEMQGPDTCRSYRWDMASGLYCLSYRDNLRR